MTNDLCQRLTLLTVGICLWLCINPTPLQAQNDSTKTEEVVDELIWAEQQGASTSRSLSLRFAGHFLPALGSYDAARGGFSLGVYTAAGPNGTFGLNVTHYSSNQANPEAVMRQSRIVGAFTLIEAVYFYSFAKKRRLRPYLGFGLGGVNVVERGFFSGPRGNLIPQDIRSTSAIMSVPVGLRLLISKKLEVYGGASFQLLFVERTSHMLWPLTLGVGYSPFAKGQIELK